MTWFSALLPVKDGVAVHATLDREARRAKAAGDPRSVGQLMADVLVQRVVHPDRAEAVDTAAAHSSAVPVMVNVMVRDTVLLGDADGTGWVEGHGPVAGDLLREWIADNAESGVATWLRRVYECPTTGRLVAMDSRASHFDNGLADFLRLRDRTCRAAGCGAPVRHSDHVVPRSRGGPTTADNGQGLCEHCNYAKEADGWSARTVPGPRHTVETTTPTGHRYTSTADRF
jgi:5-methylcytosine-specific restriction endonuclease McrA